jgi:hypothetical protein
MKEEKGREETGNETRLFERKVEIRNNREKRKERQQLLPSSLPPSSLARVDAVVSASHLQKQPCVTCASAPVRVVILTRWLCTAQAT